MDNRAYQKSLYIKRKLFAIKFLGGVCSKCQTEEDLEFDHIDPSQKDFDVSKNLKGSINRLVEELKKCQLLCRQHHASKTREESNSKRTHGKQWMAIHCKCRCTKCADFLTQYNTQRRGGTPKRERVHGTYAMYKFGCRMDCCRKANNTYLRNRKRKKGRVAQMWSERWPENPEVGGSIPPPSTKYCGVA